MDIYLDQQQLRKKRTVFRIKLYLAGFGIILFLIGVVYLMIYSPIFKVDGIKISGKDRLSDDMVLAILRPMVARGQISNFLGWNNFLVWSSGKIDVSGTALFSVNVKKDWLTRIISIDIKERERFGIWCVTGDVCYWLDESGIIFEEAPLTEGTLILKVYDKNNRPLTIGSKVIEDRFVGNLIKILTELKKLDLAIQKIVLDRELQEVRADTYGGPAILFSIRFDPAVNVNSLKDLGKTVVIEKLNYIDLRIENRIYYKN